MAAPHRVRNTRRARVRSLGRWVPARRRAPPAPTRPGRRGPRLAAPSGRRPRRAGHRAQSRRFRPGAYQRRTPTVAPRSVRRLSRLRRSRARPARRRPVRRAPRLRHRHGFRRGILMRPVELVMHGFGPFRDEVTVDFADAELIAIVGPTGHGKSSIIHAICFALYGRVPRHGDKDIAPVITLGPPAPPPAPPFTPAPH